MSEEEKLTEEEKEEKEKAITWLRGQKEAKKNFIPEAFEKYWRKREAEEREEEETEERESKED